METLEQADIMVIMSVLYYLNDFMVSPQEHAH